LAAVNVKTLTVEQIIARLEPRFQLLTGGSPASPPRHQTLQAMLDWSHNLLSAKEQRLFQRLSVFAGGWTLEAAETACSGDGLAATEIAALLARLVDESLVVAQPHGPAPRYRMLEIMRQYAQGKLSEANELKRAHARHLDFFAALTEEAEPKLFGAEQATWLKRLEAEHDNLRAALGWAQANDAQTGLRLANALWRFWDITGHWSESGERLAQLLSAAASAPTATRARALCVLGHLASQRRDLQRASAEATEGLAWSRELGDEFGMAMALKVSANVAQFQGDYPQAVALYTEGLTLFRKLKHAWGIAVSLLELAYLNLVRGQLEQAAPLFEEGLAVAQQTGDTSNRALILTGLGTLEEYRRDVERAKAYFQQALRQHRELGDQRATAIVLNRLGKVAMSQGDFGQAAAYFEESLALRRDIGERAGIAGSLHNLGHIARHQGDHNRAGALFRQALALFRELGSKAGVAWCISGLAGVAGVTGQPERAARLLGAAQAQFDALGTPGDPTDRMEHDQAVENARAQLGEAAFAAAWAEGRVMTANAWEQTVEYALGED
jgi:predicted ATPase